MDNSLAQDGSAKDERLTRAPSTVWLCQPCVAPPGTRGAGSDDEGGCSPWGSPPHASFSTDNPMCRHPQCSRHVHYRSHHPGAQGDRRATGVGLVVRVSAAVARASGGGGRGRRGRRRLRGWRPPSREPRPGRSSRPGRAGFPQPAVGSPTTEASPRSVPIPAAPESHAPISHRRGHGSAPLTSAT